MERLKRDLGIRAILALILVLAFIGVVLVMLINYGRVEISKDVMAAVMILGNIVTTAVVYYFANRSTMDKP